MIGIVPSINHDQVAEFYHNFERTKSGQQLSEKQPVPIAQTNTWAGDAGLEFGDAGLHLLKGFRLRPLVLKGHSGRM
jgi:hypothetical protein